MSCACSKAVLRLSLVTVAVAVAVAVADAVALRRSQPPLLIPHVLRSSGCGESEEWHGDAEGDWQQRQ